MRWRALACDYDDTLATEGRVATSTLVALERLLAEGRRLVLVTGRQLRDLHHVFPEAGIFDRIVGENGGVIEAPGDHARALGPPPPDGLVEELRARGVDPLERGRCVLATRREHEAVVREAIARARLPLHVVANRGSLMVLPAGVDKASGLRAAAGELGIATEAIVAVGDAENDVAFVEASGCAVAVGNAVAELCARAAVVLREERGRGVEVLADALRAHDDPRAALAA